MRNMTVAKKALSLYPINVKKIDFIGQSGNTIFKVVDNDNMVYCLRLNISKDNALDAKWISKVAINSEMEWLNALFLETDLVIQTPYKNRNGEYVTDIEGVICTLIKWIDGEQKSHVQTEEDAKQIGEMIAILHKHSSNWEVPVDFERPSYNSAYVASALEKIDNATQFSFSEESLIVLKKAGKKVIELLESLEMSKSTWGLIHADLICPNFLFDEEYGISPIDFGACGFGFYLRDIAFVFSFTPLHLRPIVFESYAKHFALPENYVELAEAFFVSGQLESLNFLLQVSKNSAWLPDFIEKLTNREFSSYVNNERFLYEGKPFWE